MPRFFKVEKDVYEQSLQRLHKEEMVRRMEFLSRIFMFSQLREEELRAVAYVMTPKRFEKNSVVIRQGETTPFQ